MGSGSQAQNIYQTNPNLALNNANTANNNMNSQEGLQNVLSAYGQGKGDLSSAMAEAGKYGAGTQQAMSNALYTDPRSATTAATNQVMSNPMTAGLYGNNNGSYQSQLMNEQNQEANQGYKMTEGDNTAYGQAAGNVAQQYGQAGNSLAQSLASRGLGGGNSGAAIQGMAGLMGGSNAALAQAQTNIAQNRMNFNLQALNDTRNQLNNVVGQGQNALNSQRNANLAGVQNQQGEQNTNIAQNAADLAAQQNQANTAWNQKQNSSFDLGKALGAVGSGLAGSTTAAAGKSLGTSLGQTLSGALGM